MSEQTIQPKAIAERYISIWNETNAGRRRAVIDELFTDRCEYIDPNVAAHGRAELEGFIGAVQSQYPGVVFTIAGQVDAHHDQARFAWHAVAPGMLEPVAIGFDVMVLDGGRIRSVYGFLDKSP